MIEDKRYHWSKLKTKTVTVSVKSHDDDGSKGMAFRVNKLIDVGTGRQTVFLDNYVSNRNDRGSDRDCYASGRIAGGGGARESLRGKRDNPPIPFRMGSFDIVYISRDVPVLTDISVLISDICKDVKVEKIVPEVLTPGDLLLFKQEGRDMRIKMVDALRIIDEKYTAGAMV